MAGGAGSGVLFAVRRKPLAEDTRFDCDCTDIHMHLMPKNGNHGCFAPTCGLEHAHDYTDVQLL